MPELPQIPAQRVPLTEGAPKFDYITREWFRFFDLLHTNSPQPGTFLPTLTPGVNVSAVSASTCYFLYTGTVVQVSGQVSLDPVAAGDTQFQMSLPVPSAFTSAGQASGIFVTTAGGFSDTGSIVADVANGTLAFRLNAVNTGAAAYAFTANYQIV